MIEFRPDTTESTTRDPPDRPKADLPLPSRSSPRAQPRSHGTPAVLALGTAPAAFASHGGGGGGGSCTELITGDSPVYKLSSLTISGQNVTIVFTQGGKASLRPDASLRATLSGDGRTLTGVFGTVPVTLTR